MTYYFHFVSLILLVINSFLTQYFLNFPYSIAQQLNTHNNELRKSSFKQNTIPQFSALEASQQLAIATLSSSELKTATVATFSSSLTWSQLLNHCYAFKWQDNWVTLDRRRALDGVGTCQGDNSYRVAQWVLVGIGELDGYRRPLATRWERRRQRLWCWRWSRWIPANAAAIRKVTCRWWWFCNTQESLAYRWLRGNIIVEERRNWR